MTELIRKPVRERADAARNRDRILAVAAELFGEHGVANVSLDAIASRAGVGKGTLFRRFGSKSGLAVALLDTQESELQSRMLFGPPPLGPGADASTRITAFFDTYLDLLDANLELVRLSETTAPGVRYRIASYCLWQRHLSVLLAEARPELDAQGTSHLLLAMVDADLQQALRRAEFTPGRIRGALGEVVRRVLEA
ncbi:TetR/AcrR family transcriptional regulator [Streptomyces sp. NBC_01264]|uniref:TetR/AcrR family transcriptional regulator n=1 Tax=Streptomyces sp. NBC_01264 TaxID=2903804 RepID=UPI002257E216|nr:TetR/AcrR family transcriptional regulator [Streptomyces sp. NBC_01264]MCX4782435.1 TetR/AcrR family transcriptional regulator [Streptomyces sp. NBC_01264]